MEKKKIGIVQMLLLVVALFFTGCRQLWNPIEQEKPVDPDASVVLVTDITLYNPLQENATESSVIRGQTLQLAVRVEPHNATNQNVAWYIDTTVEETTGEATVDQNGLVTGVAEGTVFVGASATDGSGVVSETYQVEVTQPPFVLTYDIPEGGITDFALPLRSSGAVYDLVIDWGDGSELTMVTQGTDAVHTYTVTGYVDVSITGDLRFGDIDGNGTDDGSFGDDSNSGIPSPAYGPASSTLVGVKTFGDVQFINNSATFANVNSDFTLPADKTDIPYLEGDISKMFLHTEKFNQNIDHFDISNVTSLAQVFNLATSFNQDLRKLDVRHIKNMMGLFLGARSFSQNMSEWSYWKRQPHVRYFVWLDLTYLQQNNLLNYLPQGFNCFDN